METLAGTCRKAPDLPAGAEEMFTNDSCIENKQLHMLIYGVGPSLFWALSPSPSHQEPMGSDWESLAHRADPPGPSLAVPAPTALCPMTGREWPSTPRAKVNHKSQSF